MSSVYDNDKRLYPSLEHMASAPSNDDEGHLYRLKKIEEVVAFLQNEINQREKLYKIFKRYSTSVRLVDHALIAATVISGSGSIAALCSGIGIPVSIALGGVTLCLSLATAITRKTNKLFDVKVKKHDKIVVLAQTKLDSVHDTVSRAINDSHITPDEFQRVIQEKQRYLLLKQQIRQKTKKVTEAINNQQRQTILDQGRKEGRDAFLRQIGSTLDTQPANIT